jgi:hypothetical protein
MARALQMIFDLKMNFMDGVSKVRNRVIVCVFQEPGLMEEWKADIEGNWQHGVEAEF